MKKQRHLPHPFLVRLGRAFRRFVHRLTPAAADITLSLPPFIKIVLRYRRRAA